MFLLISPARAATLAQLSRAECRYQHGHFSLERRARDFSGAFSGIDAVFNRYFGEERAIEVLAAFPEPRFVTLGGPALGGGIIGTAGLMLTLEEAQNLAPRQQLTVLFHVSRRNQFRQPMLCELEFGYE
jgi:hypothetical protein